MQRTLVRAGLAALAGMFVLVVWGMLFWAFLADPLGTFHALPNADAVTQTLVTGDVATGTYFMPWPRDTPASFAAFVEQHQRGPFYRLSYVREGVDPNSPVKLALGTLHYLLVALIAVALVLASNTTRFARRFLVVLLGGLLGSLFITIGDPIWFHLPWDYVRAVLVYEVVAWLLLAGVVGWLVPYNQGYW